MTPNLLFFLFFDDVVVAYFSLFLKTRFFPFFYILSPLYYILGVSMFTFPKHNFDSTYIVGAFVAIFVGRFLNVYPMCGLLNIGRKNKIPGNIQVGVGFPLIFSMISLLFFLSRIYWIYERIRQWPVTDTVFEVSYSGWNLVQWLMSRSRGWC